MKNYDKKLNAFQKSKRYIKCKPKVLVTNAPSTFFGWRACWGGGGGSLAAISSAPSFWIHPVKDLQYDISDLPMSLFV